MNDVDKRFEEVIMSEKTDKDGNILCDFCDKICNDRYVTKQDMSKVVSTCADHQKEAIEKLKEIDE